MPQASATKYHFGWGYDLQINDDLFQTAISDDTPLEILTAPVNPPRVQTQAHPDDFVDEVGFRYSVSDLTGGAGLRFLHGEREQRNRPIRFWDSSNVDVFRRFNDEGTGLSKEFSLVRSTTATSVDAHGWDGKHIWRDGDNFYEDNVLKKTITGSLSSAVLDDKIYVSVSGTGVNSYDLNTWGTGTNESSTAYTRLWAAKGRIFGATGNDLYEVGLGAASDTLVSTAPGGFRYVVDAGPAVLAVGYDGWTRALTVDTAGNLVEAGEFLAVPTESTTAVAEHGGTVVVATSVTTGSTYTVRVYIGKLAERSGLYSFDDLQMLFERAGSSTEVTAMVVSRDSVFFALEGDLYQVYLPTLGWAKTATVDASGFAGNSAAAVVYDDDELSVAVPQKGFYREQSTYQSSGWVIGPAADFFTVDPKQWVQARLRTTDMPDGANIELYYSVNLDAMDDPNHDSWILAARITSGTGGGDVDIFEQEGPYHIAMVRWNAPTDKLATGEFLAYAFRAFPAAGRETVYRIPVNVSDHFAKPRSKPYRKSRRGELTYRRLKDLDGQNVTVTLWSPEVSIVGVVERVEVPVIVRTDRGTWMHVSWVVVRGRESTLGRAGTSITSDGEPLGILKLGIPAMGVG